MRLQVFPDFYLNTLPVNEGSTFSCRLSQTPVSVSQFSRQEVKQWETIIKKTPSANNYGMINCHHLQWLVRNEKSQAWFLVCVTSCWPVIALVNSRHLCCWRLMAANIILQQQRAQWFTPVSSKCSVSSQTCITSVTQTLITFIMRNMCSPEGRQSFSATHEGEKIIVRWALSKNVTYCTKWVSLKGKSCFGKGGEPSILQLMLGLSLFP